MAVQSCRADIEALKTTLNRDFLYTNFIFFAQLSDALTNNAHVFQTQHTQSSNLYTSTFLYDSWLRMSRHITDTMIELCHCQPRISPWMASGIIFEDLYPYRRWTIAGVIEMLPKILSHIQSTHATCAALWDQMTHLSERAWTLQKDDATLFRDINYIRGRFFSITCAMCTLGTHVLPNVETWAQEESDAIVKCLQSV